MPAAVRPTSFTQPGSDADNADDSVASGNDRSHNGGSANGRAAHTRLDCSEPPGVTSVALSAPIARAGTCETSTLASATEHTQRKRILTSDSRVRRPCRPEHPYLGAASTRCRALSSKRESTEQCRSSAAVGFAQLDPIVGTRHSATSCIRPAAWQPVRRRFGSLRRRRIPADQQAYAAHICAPRSSSAPQTRAAETSTIVPRDATRKRRSDCVRAGRDVAHPSPLEHVTRTRAADGRDTLYRRTGCRVRRRRCRRPSRSLDATVATPSPVGQRSPGTGPGRPKVSGGFESSRRGTPRSRNPRRTSRRKRSSSRSPSGPSGRVERQSRARNLRKTRTHVRVDFRSGDGKSHPDPRR